MFVNGKAHFPMKPDDYAKGVRRFIGEFGVNIVGGCCGTTPEHLKAIVERLRDARGGRSGDVQPKPQVCSLVSGGRYPAGQQLSDRRGADEHQREPAIQAASAGR